MSAASATFDTIEPKQTLHKAVIKALALKIIEHSSDSEPLIFPSEAELCAQLGVSRSILRESVKVLAAKRMLVVRPKSGTRSCPRTEWNLLDPDVLAWQCEAKLHVKFMRDLCELRRCIDPVSAELAAERATSEEISTLGKCLVQMESAASNPEAFVEPDIRFHNVIYQASRNELIEHLAATMAKAFRTSLTYTTRLPGTLSHSLPSHRLVFEAIERRDPVAARAASEQIVRLANQEIQRLLQAEEISADR